MGEAVEAVALDEADATDSPVALAVLPVWGAAGSVKITSTVSRRRLSPSAAHHAKEEHLAIKQET
jgi:hypothetical protein